MPPQRDLGLRELWISMMRIYNGGWSFASIRRRVIGLGLDTNTPWPACGCAPSIRVDASWKRKELSFVHENDLAAAHNRYGQTPAATRSVIGDTAEGISP